MNTRIIIINKLKIFINTSVKKVNYIDFFNNKTRHIQSVKSKVTHYTVCSFNYLLYFPKCIHFIID